MKNFTIILILVIAGFSLLKSETVIIDLKKGYAMDVWYDFQGGVVKTEPANNWDIALQTNNQNAGVLINSHNLVQVWVVPESFVDSWEMQIDTTGMAENWEEGLNSVETWSAGALNLGKDGFETGGDFGWGEYNMSTHGITANKLFVLFTKDKKYKRFMIESLFAGIYTIKWADLDGSNEEILEIAKNDYSTKLFVYVDIENSQIIDREPHINEWAMIFGKYMGLTFNGTEMVPYVVTGVRTNPNFRTATVAGIPVDDAVAPLLNADNFTYKITEIGSEWKKLNHTSFTYDMVDSLTYFVTKELDGTENPVINKIVFKEFGGSATGLISFWLNEATSVEDDEAISELFVYPNVTSSGSMITINSDNELSDNFSVSIFDINGKEVHNYKNINRSLNNSMNIQLPNMNIGSYFIVVNGQNQKFIGKLIVN